MVEFGAVEIRFPPQAAGEVPTVPGMAAVGPPGWTRDPWAHRGTRERLGLPGAGSAPTAGTPGPHHSQHLRRPRRARRPQWGSPVCPQNREHLSAPEVNPGE